MGGTHNTHEVRKIRKNSGWKISRVRPVREPTHTWENNIKFHVKKTAWEDMDWIYPLRVRAVVRLT
jgi:hypothetical protein